MFGRYLKNEKGNISVIFAFTILVLIIAVGSAIDIARLMKERENARDSADAAIVATAIEMSILEIPEEYDVKENARKFMFDNVTEKYGKAKLISGTFNTDANEIVVSGEVEVPTVFMGIFGKKTLKGGFKAASGPIRKEQNTDIVLVIEHTGSAGFRSMDHIIKPLNDLIDYVHDKKGTSNIRIGTVPFSRFVNVGTTDAVDWIDFDNAYNPSNNPFEGCVHPYFDDRDGDLTRDLSADPLLAAYEHRPFGIAPFRIREHPLWPVFRSIRNPSCRQGQIQLLNDQPEQLKLSINSFVSDIGGDRYLPIGLRFGYSVLQETDPIEPQAMEGERPNKIMLLIAGGSNNFGQITPRAESDALTLRMCEQIKAEDIRIITFGHRAPSPAHREFLDSCASSPEDAFHAIVESEIEPTMAQVAKQLIIDPPIRLLR